MKLPLYDDGGRGGKVDFGGQGRRGNGGRGSDILVLVPFDPHSYGSEVAELLNRHGAGEVPMELFPRACTAENVRQALLAADAGSLFPGVREPRGAMSGLFLYFSCVHEAHELAQNIDTADGSYWHGILHRMEGDEYNAGYWFRRVGQHAIFARLRDAAAELGYKQAGAVWDPIAFTRFCHESVKSPELAKKVQLAEWQLLFDYCARGAE